MKRVLAVFLVAALLLTGCAGAQYLDTQTTDSQTSEVAADDTTSQAADAGPAQTIRISGAWALYPMMLVWADEYAKDHNVTFEVAGGGAGKGMSDVLSDQVDIGMVSRPIKQEETDQGAFYVAVTKDTVMGIINESNPVYEDILAKGLTQEDLRKIFMNEVTEWGQIFGKDLEDDNIVVYGRSDSSGAAAVWATFLGDYTEADLQNASDANVSGDQAIASSVQSDKNAISFTNMNYAYDVVSGGYVAGLRPVPIDLNADGQLSEDESFYDNKSTFLTNVANGVYPSPPTRQEFLVVNGAFEGATLEFVTWILNDGQAFLTDNGYVVLLPEEQAAEMNCLTSGVRE